MADLVLRSDLVERIQAIARREERPVDEVIEAMLARYSVPEEVHSTPSDLTEVTSRLRQDRLRLYERARRYWRSTNNERQHLTDAQLDEQFWLFDNEGVPRLKTEQGMIQLSPDPLRTMIAVMDSNPAIAWRGETDSSERAKEVFNTAYTDYLLARMSHPESTADEPNPD